MVVGDEAGSKVSGTVYSCIAAADAIHAADGSTAEATDLLLLSDAPEAAAHASTSVDHVGRVLSAIHDGLAKSLPEALAPVVASVIEKGKYSHVLFSSSAIGKGCMPRVAGMLGVSPLTDITGVQGPKVFTRNIYAGNAVTEVEVGESSPYVIAIVRGTAFDGRALAVDGTLSTTVVPVDVSEEAMKEAADLSSFVRDDVASGDRPSLTDANVVISGGRGLKNGENFKLLDAMGEPLGAAIGASRAAVDAGFVPNSYQVGQTGKVVAPDLYIAVGISGAIQHLAGMKDSKTIAAINTDPDAPIYKVADVGLVQDLFEAVPKVTALIEEKRSA